MPAAPSTSVVAIAAQPFLLRAPAGGRVRRHVPDFLLLHADQTVQMVNVKPAARLVLELREDED